MESQFLAFLLWPGTAIAIGVLLVVALRQGAQLGDLRQRVERLERDSYGGAPPPASYVAPAGSAAITSLEGLSDEQSEHLRRLLRQRQKIQAIKDVREWTGSGLKESKDYVETLEAQMKAQGDL